MKHVPCTGSRQVGGVSENGYTGINTGMSPSTSLELPSAIPNMYVYIKCIMKCVQEQIRSAETTATGGVSENDMQSFTSR